MANQRDRMVKGAAEVLARQGLRAASMSTVLERTGAPRGSIYHYFPEGKQQLASEAVTVVADRVLALLTAVRGRPAPVVIDELLAAFRHVLASSDLAAGCAVAAVAVEPDPDMPDLSRLVGDVFADWRRTLAAALRDGGASDPQELATMAIASIEGALILSRAERSLAPYDSVATVLLRLTTQATKPPPL